MSGLLYYATVVRRVNIQQCVFARIKLINIQIQSIFSFPQYYYVVSVGLAVRLNQDPWQLSIAITHTGGNVKYSPLHTWLANASM